jgi:membrane protease YdiL (CAAX protease family)
MTMITATHPLAGLSSESPSTIADTRPRPWGFWATLGYFGVAVVTFFAAAIMCGIGYGLWWALAHQGQVFKPEDAPVALYAITVIAMAAAGAVLVLAARGAKWSARDYLGLTMPKPRHVLVGLASLLAFGLAAFGLEYLFPAFDQTPVMVSEYRALLGSPSGLVMFWLSLVVIAPVSEEIIFRGFLFRGWSASRLGAVGALVLTSLIFASLHVQYTVPGMIEVFAGGLLLGVARWRTGSTVLAILLHATWNLVNGALVMMVA